MNKTIEDEVSIEHAKASIPFPVIEQNEVIVQVIKVINAGKRSYKFYTNTGRVLIKEE